MRESSLVPTNLLDWPRCESLLPDQRLILLSLWSSRYLNCAGTGMYPIRPAASSLGLSPDALDGGLNTLETAKLIDRDKETGEIFILDWFRFHHFKTEMSQKMLDAAIGKIASARLKNIVIEKSGGYLPTTTSSASPSSTTTDDADLTSSNEFVVGGGNSFSIPKEFSDTFLRMTKDLNAKVQADVADEFIGQLRSGKVRKPEALLRTLAAAAKNGTLTLDAAREERQRREMESRVEALRADAKKIEIDGEAAKAGIDLLAKIAPGLAAKAGSHGSEA